MRTVLLVFAAGALFAQQPILYNRGAVNAASLAPAGLPNAPIAQGSVFTVFGEHLGPAQSPALSFPLSSTLGGVSLSVTQGGVTTRTFPIFISAGQVNAIMPSTVATGLATLRLFYQGVKSNAITISIFPSAPGIFAVSGGGYGPGSIQNFVSRTNQPVNSMVTPAAPGQVITIWGTGLGPVTFPDNVAPTPGNVATPVTLTIGGQPATAAYSGRSPCCAGVDQIVATVPATAPFGCWVPVYVNAGGVISNTATMAIAAAGASSCSDPGNPLSILARTAGTQAFIHLERVDSVENIAYNPAVLKTLDKIYTRFYTRPASPYAFDPYMSFPPACPRAYRLYLPITMLKGTSNTGRFLDTEDRLMPLSELQTRSSSLPAITTLPLVSGRPSHEGFPSGRDHVRSDLETFVDALKDGHGNRNAVAKAVVGFVQATTTGFNAASYANIFLEDVADGCAKTRRKRPARVQALARLIVDEPNHVGASKVVARIAELRAADADFRPIQLDCYREFHEAARLGTFETAEVGFHEISRHRTYSRPQPPDKAISTIHKAKGLECKNVIIMPCDAKSFPDNQISRCLLYVAMSRASSRLMLVIPRASPSPLLII